MLIRAFTATAAATTTARILAAAAQFNFTKVVSKPNQNYWDDLMQNIDLSFLAVLSTLPCIENPPDLDIITIRATKTTKSF